MKPFSNPVYHRFDRVEIVEPLVFVRCGYPMSWDETYNQLTETYESQIITDLDGLARGYISAGWPEHLARSLPNAYSDIIHHLTKAHLNKNRYGGNERAIHTRLDERFRGKIARVMGKRVVKTGRYRKGYGPSGYGDDDGAPPTLENVKTHVILEVEMYTGPEPWDFEHFEIEARHVRPHEEKISTFSP